MKLRNKPMASGEDSFQQAPAGKYLMILIGVADIGTQPGGQFDPRACVQLRWELHSRKGPVKDGEGRIYTVSQTYTATVRGDKSNLGKVIRNHGIEIPLNGETDSHSWLGCTAWANLVKETSKKGKEYTNAEGFSVFDSEADDLAPPVQVLASEHWEPSDGCACPPWANYWVSNSTDLMEYSSDLDHYPPFGTKMKEETVPPSDGEEDDGTGIPF